MHVSTPEDASLDKAFEDTWDEVCKVHAERTEGTDEFVKREVTNDIRVERKSLFCFLVSFRLHAQKRGSMAIDW